MSAPQVKRDSLGGTDALPLSRRQVSVTEPTVPSPDRGRQLVLRLACLVIALETIIYARYFLLFGPAKVVEYALVLGFLGLLFLNLYVGQRWSRWLLVAIGAWIALRSILAVVGASIARDGAVALLVGLRAAAYIFVAWRLSRSPELDAFLAEPGGHASAALTRLVSVVSYGFAAVVVFGAAAHLPLLRACLGPSGCSATVNALGALLLLLALIVIGVAGWVGRLPGYGRRFP